MITLKILLLKSRDQVSQLTAEARLAREQSEKDAIRHETYKDNGHV
jgi:hypothetical protein